VAVSPPLTREVLAAQLRALGLGDGDVVLFHSSLKRIGWVEPGPGAVVEAFLDVVGASGTVAVPTLVPALQGIRPRFDVATTPSEAGRLTEAVRCWPGARRSDHPTHSVAAVGRLAEALTARHRDAWGPPSPWGRQAVGFDTPWDRLRALDAWVLLIGVDFSRCTLLHHVQARYLAGHEGTTREPPWPAFDLRRMGEHLEAAGLVRRGRLGGAECRLARAAGIVEAALGALEADPRSWLTGPPLAAWLDVRETVRSRGRPRAAAFKVDITPETPAKPVARPLHARGVLLDHPLGSRAALVVCDHGGFYHGEALTVRRAIGAAADIPAEAVLLVATHDHSAHHHHRVPDDAYVRLVASRAARAAVEAATRLEPVRAGWTCARAPGIRQNRTVYLRDGRAYTERWLIPSTWHVAPADVLRRGPDDDDLRLLVLERLDGTRLAILADFSCHAMAGMHDPRLHDDFLGVAMETVERAEGGEGGEGGGTVVLCTPGSEGDQNPSAMIRLGGDLVLDYALRLGRRLGGEILAAVQDVPVHDVFALGTGRVPLEVPVREDWRRLAAGTAHPELQAWLGAGRAPAEVTALAVGDFALVGIPAELFTAPAQRVRAHSPFLHTAVVGLANGKLMYVAEGEAFFEGSTIYGVEPDFPAMAQPGADRLLADAGLRALRQARAAQAGVDAVTGAEEEHGRWSV
jgi:aminoglycoside 3-N-acetyltransferase